MPLNFIPYLSGFVKVSKLGWKSVLTIGTLEPCVHVLFATNHAGIKLNEGTQAWPYQIYPLIQPSSIEW